MKLVLFVLVCGCSSFVYAKHTASKNIETIKANYVTADRALNVAYQNLLHYSEGDSILKSQLRNTQRRWILFRDLESVLFEPYTSPSKSHLSETWYRSMIILSKRRTSIIENNTIQTDTVAKWDEALAEQQLNKSYQDLLTQYSSYPAFITKLTKAEQAWIKYREAAGMYSMENTKTITETRIRVLRQFPNANFQNMIEHLYKKKRISH